MQSVIIVLTRKKEQKICKVHSIMGAEKLLFKKRREVLRGGGHYEVISVLSLITLTYPRKRGHSVMANCEDE